MHSTPIVWSNLKTTFDQSPAVQDVAVVYSIQLVNSFFLLQAIRFGSGLARLALKGEETP